MGTEEGGGDAKNVVMPSKTEAFAGGFSCGLLLLL